MNRLTLGQLKQAGACAYGRRIFARLFPDGAPLTLNAARKAIAHDLDIEWLCNLLPPSAVERAKRKIVRAWWTYWHTLRRSWKLRDADLAAARNWVEKDRARERNAIRVGEARRLYQLDVARALIPELRRIEG